MTDTDQPTTRAALYNEVLRAANAIIGDLGQVDSEGYYNGVVHKTDVQYLEQTLAAFRAAPTQVEEKVILREGVRTVLEINKNTQIWHPLSTLPPNTYVLMLFEDGATSDTEFPGVAVGKLYNDADIFLTAGWASTRAHADPIAWAPLPAVNATDYENNQDSDEQTDAHEIWARPEYAAADKARSEHLTQDSNDQMGALAAAVDAAFQAAFQAASQEAEPVAWLHKHADYPNEFHLSGQPGLTKDDVAHGWSESPLYELPTSSNSR